MTLTEFAKARGISTQALSMYINRHIAEFHDHVNRIGKTVEIDETALKLLDKKYPVPKPVTVTVDKEAREENDQLRRTITELAIRNAELEREKADYQGLIAEIKANQILLEEKEDRIAELKTQIETERQEQQAISEKLENETKRADDIEKKLIEAKYEKELMQIDLQGMNFWQFRRWKKTQKRNNE